MNTSQNSHRRIHILFITENFPPERNASATRVYERACYWIKWGHEVTVITCAPNFPEGKVYPGYKNRWYQVEQMDGIRVVRVKTFISANKGFLLRSLDFVSFMFTSIAAGFFQKKPDIVMATSPQFFAAVSGWVISLFKRQPFIFELGDLWPASITAVGAMKDNLTLRIMEKLELFLYRKSAAIVALTNAFREDLIRRGIDKSKIHVVVNGVDLPRYSPRPKDSDLLEELGLKDKFVIGYIGTPWQRIFVNSGISCYGNSRERLMQRGTACHNTLVVDGKNSSEVWDGFRVAKRAYPLGLENEDKGKEGLWIRCGHDGYTRLKGKPVHWREWCLKDNSLEIKDQVTGDFSEAVAFYHLYPGLVVDSRNRRIFSDDISMTYETDANIFIENQHYYPEFGKAVPNECLVVKPIRDEYYIKFKWDVRCEM